MRSACPQSNQTVSLERYVMNVLLVNTQRDDSASLVTDESLCARFNNVIWVEVDTYVEGGSCEAVISHVNSKSVEVAGETYTKSEIISTPNPKIAEMESAGWEAIGRNAQYFEPQTKRYIRFRKVQPVRCAAVRLKTLKDVREFIIEQDTVLEPAYNHSLPLVDDRQLVVRV